MSLIKAFSKSCLVVASLWAIGLVGHMIYVKYGQGSTFLYGVTVFALVVLTLGIWAEDNYLW